MGQYLRDEKIKNVTINETALEQINDALTERLREHNAALIASNPQLAVADGVKQTSTPNPKVLLLIYTIRFDGKGFRYVDFADVLKAYSQAKTVERVVFALDSVESIASTRARGDYAEVRLDPSDEAGCFYIASSDSRDWCEAAFATMRETLGKMKNMNWMVRNGWTPALIQLLGVVLIFTLSVWGAARIAPHVTIESPFAVSLIFVLIILSNIWGYVSQQLGRLINFTFPNLKFDRKDKQAMHWALKWLIGGPAATAGIWLLNLAWGFAASVFNALVKL